MARFRWIALQGSSRGFLPLPLLFVFLITTSAIPAFAADVSAACISPVARVVSIQGSIEVLRARQTDWSKVTRLDTSLCEGDKLRTGALSRAALFIQPETLVRVDQNTSLSVSQTAEETLVEFTQEDVLPAAAGAYTCGAGYFISRFPRKFRVNTPHLNAAVEGTEFLVAMRCESTELSVFEGKVLAAGAGANVFPAQSISSGQILTIGGSEPPAIKLLVNAADAVQWVLYYPPLSDATAEADLPSTEQCRSLPKPLDQTCLTQRAETLLRLGRVDEAQREVEEAVALDPGRGDANALRAIISIARNDKAGAIEAATSATTASPNSFRAWLALSYAQQASFKLEDSLLSARKAQALEPNSSVTNARVAELLMSLGRIKEAEVAARAAVDANPAESRAHTVLGFVRLAQIKTKEARTDFHAAIERDSSDPLPRLGLGLAIIRTGKLADGREQLEIAVALDPTNSLLRSYVGKAYYEENSRERDKLAETQFGLAKELDSYDPTPWFYDAILKQTQNRPVEALENLQKSIERNDNRAPYRSKLAIDQDLASRSAGLARIYSKLGFDQLALIEATKSLSADPASYSAHRLLSDSYANLPRHDIARQSELLQSQLMQPLVISPISPLRTPESQGIAPNAGIPKGITSPSVGVNEFTSLFDRNDVKFFADGLGGQENTWLDQIVGSVLHDNIAITVGQGHFETDGFGENQDFQQNGFSILGQVAPDFGTTLQAELSQLSVRRGETLTPWDPIFVFPLRIFDEVTRMRIGARVDLSPGTSLILSGSSQNRELTVTDILAGVDTQSEVNASTGEAQYLKSSEWLRMVVGAGYLGTSSMQPQEVRSSYSTFYGYAQVPLHDFKFTIGVSKDNINRPGFGLDEVSPKLGIVWTPWQGTTFRAASFQSVKRELIGSQTIEPTQVAGFNQFFDDPTGSRARRYGLALDQAVGRRFLVGAEASGREILVPVIGLGFVEQFSWRESAARTYAHWSIPNQSRSWSAALRIEYEYEELKRPEELSGVEGFRLLDTRHLPISLAAFVRDRFSGKVTATHVRQKAHLQTFQGTDQFFFDEEFWVTDVELSYLLQKRRGSISVSGRNVLNTGLGTFQDSDPATPRFAKGRLVFGRITLAF